MYSIVPTLQWTTLISLNSWNLKVGCLSLVSCLDVFMESREKNRYLQKGLHLTYIYTPTLGWNWERFYKSNWYPKKTFTDDLREVFCTKALLMFIVGGLQKASLE